MAGVQHHFNTRQQSIKIVRSIQKLETEIKNYYNNCDDRQKYWKSKLKGLKEIKDELQMDINGYETFKNLDDFATYHFPVSRKYKNESEALRIFFIKKIYLLFKEHYGKPMYSNIASLIYAIFQHEYSHDEIASIVKNIRYARKFGRLKDQKKFKAPVNEKVKFSLT